MNKLAQEVENITHKSVLLKESIEYIRPIEDGVYIDATLGLGSHTRHLLESTNFSSRIIGFDVDEEAISIAKERLSDYKDNIHFLNKNFYEIDCVSSEFNLDEVDGIIADLGMSSYQLEHSNRGFSFMRSEPLDMRMDAKLQFTAYDLVNEMSAEELSNLFRDYGEESFSKKIAKSIIKSRQQKPIQTSKELAALISNSIPRKFHPKKIHPATKSFQALRIAVNNELENLKIFIEKAVKLLKPGGRLVIISFHSLEDRIVKQSFKELHASCICPPEIPVCACEKESIVKIITRSPVTPGEDEMIENPRSRSSKMRVVEKI